MPNCSVLLSTGSNTAATVTTITVVIVLILGIIFGNILTIAAVLTDRKLQQVQNWFIVSLAVADLLVGLLVMPLTLAYEVLGQWVLGPVMCEVWLALDVLFVTSSILNICSISLDRYWSVTDPLGYGCERSRKRVLVLIGSAWFLALFISLPPLVGWHQERNEPGTCEVSTRPGYVLYSSIGSFFLPSLVLIGSYAKIYHVTRLRERRLSSTAGVWDSGFASSKSSVVPETTAPQFHVTTVADANDCGSSSGDQDPDLGGGNGNNTPARRKQAQVMGNVLPMLAQSIRQGALYIPRPTTLNEARSCNNNNYYQKLSVPFVALLRKNSSFLEMDEDAAAIRLDVSKQPAANQNQRQRNARKRERRATVVLGFILFGFILCWLPFFTVYLMNAVCCSAPKPVFDVFFWLGYCNSALNPMIYAAVNMQFRRAFQKMLHLRR